MHMGFLLFPRFSSFGKVMSVINVEDQIIHAAHCRMAREILIYTRIYVSIFNNLEYFHAW